MNSTVVSSESKMDVEDGFNKLSANHVCTEWWCNEAKVIKWFQLSSILMCVLGGLGNLVTILAILFSSLRFNVNCILIASQSFAGFLYCSLIMSMQTVVFYRHSSHIDQSFCSAAGGMRYTLVGVIMDHLAAIALYRFLNIVHISKYRYMSENRQLIITLVICWCLPLAFTVPPSLRVWGAFTYQSEILQCTFDSAASHSNRLITVSFGFILPCILIIFCYARIGCVAFTSFRRVRTTNSPSKAALKLSAMMLCIFFLFFGGTFPYFILNVTDKNFRYPVHHIWTTLLGWLSYCLNPIVYAAMDKNIRTAYKKLFQGKCEKNPIRMETSIGTS